MLRLHQWRIGLEVVYVLCHATLKKQEHKEITSNFSKFVHALLIDGSECTHFFSFRNIEQAEALSILHGCDVFQFGSILV